MAGGGIRLYKEKLQAHVVSGWVQAGEVLGNLRELWGVLGRIREYWGVLVKILHLELPP